MYRRRSLARNAFCLSQQNPSRSGDVPRKVSRLTWTRQGLAGSQTGDAIRGIVRDKTEARPHQFSGEFGARRVSADHDSIRNRKANDNHAILTPLHHIAERFAMWTY